MTGGGRQAAIDHHQQIREERDEKCQ